jgi:hypothetical protein
VPERVAIKISGQRTRAVFDDYRIGSTDNLTGAMRRVGPNGSVGENSEEVSPRDFPQVAEAKAGA